MFLNDKLYNDNATKFLLNRKHEMFLNDKIIPLLLRAIVLNRKHEMFLNATSNL